MSGLKHSSGSQLVSYFFFRLILISYFSSLVSQRERERRETALKSSIVIDFVVSRWFVRLLTTFSLIFLSLILNYLYSTFCSGWHSSTTETACPRFGKINETNL